jgi:hypothetical protein
MIRSSTLRSVTTHLPISSTTPTAAMPGTSGGSAPCANTSQRLTIALAGLVATAAADADFAYWGAGTGKSKRCNTSGSPNLFRTATRMVAPR